MPPSSLQKQRWWQILLRFEDTDSQHRRTADGV